MTGRFGYHRAMSMSREQEVLEAVAALHRRGVELGNSDRWMEGIAALKQAVALSPNSHAIYRDMAKILGDRKKLGESALSYRQAIRLNPGHWETHFGLGTVLRERGEYEQAMAAFRRAIDIQPDRAEIFNGLGVVLTDLGYFDEAVGAHREAIRLRPDYATAHWNLGWLLLLLGDFKQGWVEYEWRFKCLSLHQPMTLSKPQWDGRNIDGRTLFLHVEQGFGDTIQFVRYVPLIAARGAKMILGCSAEMARLLGNTVGVHKLVTRAGQVSEYDFHCPMASLPAVFDTNAQSIPNQVPYLNADADLIARWRSKLGISGEQINVGLTWAGGLTQGDERYKSMDLAQLAPLFDVSGVKFYSLQLGPAVSQIRSAPRGFNLFDPTSDIADFADTAAIIANLDVIISVDTAVAHLAGAMGKPTWVLLRKVPDWRWQLEREDSPWYPTMWLFRQQAIGEWKDVVARMAESLRAYRRE